MNQLKGIDRDEFKPLYVQIAEQLIAYIKENDLKAGDPLPVKNMNPYNFLASFILPQK